MNGIQSFKDGVIVENFHHFSLGYLKSQGKQTNNVVISKEDKEKLINLIVAQKRSANPSESTFLRPVATFIEEIQFLETYPIRKRKVDFGYGAIDTYERKI